MPSRYVPAAMMRVSPPDRQARPALIVNFGVEADCAPAQVLLSLPVLAT